MYRSDRKGLTTKNSIILDISWKRSVFKPQKITRIALFHEKRCSVTLICTIFNHLTCANVNTCTIPVCPPVLNDILYNPRGIHKGVFCLCTPLMCTRKWEPIRMLYIGTRCIPLKNSSCVTRHLFFTWAKDISHCNWSIVNFPKETTLKIRLKQWVEICFASSNRVFLYYIKCSQCLAFLCRLNLKTNLETSISSILIQSTMKNINLLWNWSQLFPIYFHWNLHKNANAANFVNYRETRLFVKAHLLQDFYMNGMASRIYNRNIHTLYSPHRMFSVDLIISTKSILLVCEVFIATTMEEFIS